MPRLAFPKWLVIRFQLEWLAVPVCLLAIVLFFSAEQHRKQTLATQVRQDQLSAFAIESEQFRQPITAAVHDLTVLSQFIQRDSADLTLNQELQSAMAALMLSRDTVMQARVLTLDGKELLRLNRVGSNGGIRWVPATELQDKSQRDYVRRMQTLSVGQFYISKIDLNVEHNEVVQPYQPTIRIGKRIAAPDQQSTDLLVLINLDLTAVFNRFKAIRGKDNENWLVNGQGDWLIGPRPEVEWGFMFGRQQRMAQLLAPELAQRLLVSEQPSTEVTEDHGLYLNMPVPLLNEVPFAGSVVDASPRLIRYFPPRYLTRIYQETELLSVWQLALFVIIGGSTLALLLRTWRRHLILHQDVREWRKESERLQGIANFLPQLTWTCNPQGSCDFISESWSRYTGIANSQLLGSGWTACVHPDDRAVLEQRWQHSVASGKDLYVRFRIRNSYGQYRMFDTRATALKDKLGRIVQWFGSNTDIQDSVDIQHALELEKQRLREDLAQSMQQQINVLDRLKVATMAAGIAIWEFDVVQNQLIWDEQMYELYGERNRERPLNYLDWRNAVHHDDIERVEQQLQATLANGAPFATEFRIVRIPNNEIWVKAEAVAVKDAQGQIIRLVGCNIDITQNKQLNASLAEANQQLSFALQKAKAAVDTKTRFLANMSHEIRTPMNGILGMLTLLTETVLAPQQQLYARKAQHAAERLLAILNDILDLARIESGYFSLNDSEFALEQLIQDGIGLFATTAEQKQIGLLVTVAPNVPVNLSGDLLRISQIIANLVGNALKFTEASGTVQVTLGWRQYTNSSWLELSVLDTGIGMSDEEQARIFNAFAQADDSTTRRYGGTGLGLSICQRLVLLMKGDIAVQSEPGKGSTFTVTLPLTTAPLSEVEAASLWLLSRDPALQQQCQQLCDAQHWSYHPVSNFAQLTVELSALATSSQPIWLIADLTRELANSNSAELLRRQLAAISRPLRTVLVVPQTLTMELRSQVVDVASCLLSAPASSSTLRSTLLSVQLRGLPQPKQDFEPAQLAALRVLTVDDLAINNEVIEGLLTKLGAQVTRASGGQQAIALVQNQVFDVVLMDVHMDDISGLQATAAIRGLADIQQPLIFGVSASVLPEERAAGIASGMNAYLMKPFKLSDFLQCLTQFQSAPTAKLAAAPVKKLANQPTLYPHFIELDAALTQLAGDHQLLMRCIQSFVDNFQEFARLYRGAVNQQQLDSAKALMHKLKGAARYIGDEVLSDAAGVQEREHQQLQWGQPEHVLQLFERHLAELQRFLESQVSNVVALHKPMTDDEWLAAQQWLMDKACKNRFVPVEKWQPIIRELTRRGEAQMAKQLQQALEQFRFTEVKQILQQLPQNVTAIKS